MDSSLTVPYQNEQEGSTSQPGAACRRMHVALCAAQCSFWHAFPQYLTDLHPLQSRGLPFSNIPSVTPHPAHGQTLRAVRLRALAVTWGTPPGDKVGSGAANGWSRSGLAGEASPVPKRALVPGTDRSGCKVWAAGGERWSLGCLEPVPPTC
jgi:hypothetical protein